MMHDKNNMGKGINRTPHHKFRHRSRYFHVPSCPRFTPTIPSPFPQYDLIHISSYSSRSVGFSIRFHLFIRSCDSGNM